MVEESKTIVPIPTKDLNLFGSHNSELGIYVNLPAAGIVHGPDYFMRAHELEHHFQSIAESTLLDFKQRTILKTQAYIGALIYPIGLMRYFRSKFLMEEGGMSAEWFFYHHLPAEVIQQTRDLIAKIPDDGKGKVSKAFFLLTLEKSQKSRNEYLDFNRKRMQRYGFKKYSRRYLQLLAIVGGYGMLALSDAIVKEDKKLRHKTPDSPALLGFDQLEAEWIFVKDLFNAYSIWDYE
jgi:hypothetical protein